MTLWRRITGLIGSFIQREPAPVPTPLPPPTQSILSGPPTAEALFVAINAQRTRYGKPRLTAIDPGLTVADSAHAAWMASTGVMSHAGFEQRMSSTHPDRDGGENVAEGQRTVAEVMASWMNSSGHRANILGDYNAVGIGIATSRSGVTFWCTTFVKI